MATVPRAWALAHTIRQDSAAASGLALIGGIVLLALAAPYLTPHPPEQADFNAFLAPPSRLHPLGTDTNGMDVLSRLLYAPRIDLAIAIGATVLAIAMGGPLGLLAGFYGGWVDDLLVRSVDVLQAFPVFILALALVAVTGNNIGSVVWVMAIVEFPVYLRLLRAEALSHRDRLYVRAARSVGNPTWRIVLRHLAPNCLTPIFPQAAIHVSTGILAVAGLGFLGVGIRVPTPEWGSMIAVGAKHMVSGEWWVSVFPGVALVITSLGFNLLGRGLQRVADPRQR
jgi:peptide/nickel transport system permease protein